MPDYVIVTPGSLRGGGFILESRNVSDFMHSECDLIVHSETIDDLPANVFRLSNGTIEGYSVAEVMSLIDDTLVKNLTFSNNQIRYTLMEPEDVTSVSDLNGVIVGLRYSEGKIVYDTFESDNALLYDSDLTVLAGALTSITYDSSNFKIKYDTVGEISEQ